MHTFSFNDQRGVSALELLIGVAILALLAAVVLGSFSGFRNTQVLQHETDSVMSLLARARSESLSSLDSSSYGVRFEDNQMTFFKGAVFSEGSAGNEIVPINSAVTISSISLSGASDEVVFDRRTGDANAPGTITLQLVSDGTRTRTVTITETGVISSN